MKTQESFRNFKSDIDNLIELIKENLDSIKKDIKENKKNTAATIKSIFLINAVASDIIKTNEIYFNSSVSKIINTLDNPELEGSIKNYLLKSKHEIEKGIKEVKEKRSIKKETDESEDFLKSSFYEIKELFGSVVEYFAIIKNIAHAADIPEEQKPALIIENLNSMLADILSLEITVKDNIITIILHEINKNKEEANIKNAAWLETQLGSWLERSVRISDSKNKILKIKGE